MGDAFIIDAVRTPVTRAHPEKGWLRDVRADELGVLVLQELVRRTGVAPVEIEDVILGCATQAGEQAMNLARYVVVMAGFPYEVAAQTINRQCASSMSALHSAAQAIMTGCGSVMVAGGIESMTHLPEGFSAELNPRRFDFMDCSAASMGLTAENLAEMYGISRREQEEFALWSHRKAVAARREGRFAEEIVPVPVPESDGTGGLVAWDQNPRPDTSLDIMAALEPISGRPEGTVTAATSTRASDGAAAVLLTSGERARALGLKPLARVVSMAVAGVDPKLMGMGAVAAGRKALERARLSIGDIDVAEINEAFAVVALVAIRELGIDPQKVNPNGGAVALGHPMGATGARMVTTLVHEMDWRRARYGLATMCVGMGQGAAVVLERVDSR